MVVRQLIPLLLTIHLSLTLKLFEYDIIQYRHRRAAVSDKNLLWPKAVIPFLFHDSIDESLIPFFYEASGIWQKNTCIKFVNRTTESDYLIVKNGLDICGCCSYVGRIGGEQPIYLSKKCLVSSGKFRAGIFLHEIGHAIGFYHEHARPDRNKYIKIIRDNIKSGHEVNFEMKSKKHIDSLGQEYDFLSIMHYHQTSFSKVNTAAIQPLDKYRSQTIIEEMGQRSYLSEGDKKQTNLLYSCYKLITDESLPSTTNNPVKSALMAMKTTTSTLAHMAVE
ncbi:hypothetical protein SNEBB_011120 [Seison nebaliae]|nr:hypothetical protein SNEBB_011120 [Seison nebaliae]